MSRRPSKTGPAARAAAAPAAAAYAHARGRSAARDGSNGGLRVRAAMAVPDELVDAVALRVLDMLREQQQYQQHWIGVQDAAAHLACPVSRIYRLVSQRRIPFERDGARLLFRRSDLDEWVANGGAR